MPNKVRVYGKAQNRTALGIVHAYMKMHPHATLEDLRKAFPDSINPDKGVDEIFIPAQDKGTTANWDGYFRADDEVITLADGQKVAVVKMWTKPSIQRMIDQAALYDVETAQMLPADPGAKKGGFRLEYLNGYVPPVPEQRRKVPVWLWLLLLLLAAAVVLFIIFWPRGDKEPQVVERVVERPVLVHDTLYVQQVAEIERNFNAAKFEANKSDLNDDAKLALHDLAKVMKQNPGVRLTVVGHTSAEGSPAVNQKLSEQRAQAAVDFLTSKEGIDPDRVSALGKGSSEPLDPDKPELNRRTEFQIVDEPTK